MTFFPFCKHCGKAVESTTHVVRDCDFAQIVRKLLVPRLKWNAFFNLHVGHNDFIFNNTSRSSHELVASTLAWVKSFGFSGNIEQLWIGVMSNTKATIGGAVRDSSEVWLVGFKMVTVVSNVFQIEARAVVEGLKLIWSRGFKQVEVDCDNAMLIDTIRNGFALINNIEEVRLIHELYTKD
ncbi:hypothetical protein Golob_001658 [Gossypium lobatum]|uniref:RNase H type-1 domain-containing protein n=1 Tax=Gossypium lobatum TaxID=34289 RepID=A0A7J8NC75_9ROSI|nr:hypothetical protein [Gossypium lobatum]